VPSIAGSWGARAKVGKNVAALLLADDLDSHSLS